MEEVDMTQEWEREFQRWQREIEQARDLGDWEMFEVLRREMGHDDSDYH